MNRLFLSITTLLTLGSPSLAESQVLKLYVKGVINPIIADYIKDGIREAEKTESKAILIQMDTPGGLLDATREIISEMINSELPVFVFVGPRGARATSAGLFITMASDVAVMAPETHLGAAHPVTITGDSPGQPQPKEDSYQKSEKSDETTQANEAPKSPMSEKMVSDAAAYIRALAKERGRNAEWAEKAVRESVSLTSREALEDNVIDYMAESPDSLIRNWEKKTIKKNAKEITIDLDGATILDFPMDWVRQFLHMIAHPNVAYILMTIGIYALIYELASPGGFIGGIVGVICLLFAFLSLQVLPINTVGLILLLLGMSLLIIDLFTPTNGILSGLGLIAFTLGSFLLIRGGPDIPYSQVSLSLILPTVLVTGGFFGFVIRKIFISRKQPVQLESLVGKTGIVKERISPQGLVIVEGELWTAQSGEEIDEQAHIEIVEQRGNILKVKKIN